MRHWTLTADLKTGRTAIISRLWERFSGVFAQALRLRTKISAARRQKRLASVCCVLTTRMFLLVGCIASALCHPAQAAEPEELLLSPQRSTSDLTQQLSATMHRIEGPEKCLDCHRSEYLATARTHHATE
ncbi:MAG: hypothetical protein MI725_11965, partial [Pirellulales bacterium]|nr:hypothetical protein [Pirellulales bacterium]